MTKSSPLQTASGQRSVFRTTEGKTPAGNGRAQRSEIGLAAPRGTLHDPITGLPNEHFLLGGLNGIDPGSAGKLLQILAPLVMGALSKEKSRLNLDPKGLGDLLGMESERTAVNGGGSAMDMLSKVLNSDGSITDDLASMGKGLLGSMFGKK